jgi:hypothetical protein
MPLHHLHIVGEVIHHVSLGVHPIWVIFCSELRQKVGTGVVLSCLIVSGDLSANVLQLLSITNRVKLGVTNQEQVTEKIGEPRVE